MPYSTLFAGVSLSAGTTSIYTVPGSYVAVLREVDAINLYAGANVLALVATIPGPAAIQFTNHSLAAFGEEYQWRGRLVLPAGSVLSAEVIGDTVDAMFSGYLLSAP